MLVEGRTEKVAAQRQFAKGMEAAWTHSERRTVVWRPSSKVLPIAHNNRFWFAQIRPHDDQQTRRYWNSFGGYDQAGNLQIVVEINIPVDGNTRRVSGFFAKDAISGQFYLMHDGGVGGGRTGIGQENFLRWTSKQPVPVIASDGSVRFGIIVSGLSVDLSNNVSSFVQSVLDFKAAVMAGDPIAVQQVESGTGYQDYFKEFSGQKKGKRAREFEYITRHGDIVHALSAWIRRNGTNRNLRIVKNQLIDLGVKNTKDQLVEIYEVKTNSLRQTLYTAIGQLLVHGEASIASAQKYLVVPKGEVIPADIKSALVKLNIRVVWFVLHKNDVLIEA